MKRKVTYIDVAEMDFKKVEKFIKILKDSFRKRQEQKNIEQHNNKMPKNYPKTF